VQISAGTSLAQRYNDVAPLENHHCSFAFRLLDDPATNPFHSLTVEQVRPNAVGNETVPIRYDARCCFSVQSKADARSA